MESNRNSKTLGKQAENFAAEFLKQRGCRLIVRNFRTRSGEIDLIVWDRECLCFVEVKARYGQHTPQEAVSILKQQKLSRMAKMFMNKHFHHMEVLCRFDVIAIESNQDGSVHLDWIRNAFDAID